MKRNILSRQVSAIWSLGSCSQKAKGYETDPANLAKRGPDYVRPDEGISLSNGLKIESVSRSEGNFEPSGAGRSIWLT